MKTKTDWLGFTLLPAGVAATFLGIGSFSRESTTLALALLGVGSVLLALAWRLLKETEHGKVTPETPLSEARAPRVLEKAASTTEGTDVGARASAAE